MIGACEATLAGHCVGWSPLRIIMTTVLGSAALVTLDHWWLQRGGRDE